MDFNAVLERVPDHGHTPHQLKYAWAGLRPIPTCHRERQPYAKQVKGFLARIDEPDKNWKVSSADIEERKFWKQYRTAYEECPSATSTDDSPWFVVPADEKENARLIVSQIVVDTLEDLEMSYPKVTAECARQLQSIRDGLVA